MKSFITLPVTNGIWDRLRWKCSCGSRPGCLALLGYFRPTAPRADTGMVLVAEVALFFLRLGFVLSTWVSLCNRHFKMSTSRCYQIIHRLINNLNPVMYPGNNKLKFTNQQLRFMWHWALISNCHIFIVVLAETEWFINCKEKWTTMVQKLWLTRKISLTQSQRSREKLTNQKCTANCWIQLLFRWLISHSDQKNKLALRFPLKIATQRYFNRLDALPDC